MRPVDDVGYCCTNSNSRYTRPLLSPHIGWMLLPVELRRRERDCQRTFDSSQECLLDVCPLNFGHTLLRPFQGRVGVPSSRPWLALAADCPPPFKISQCIQQSHVLTLRTAYSSSCPRRRYIADTFCNQLRMHTQPCPGELSLDKLFIS